MARSTAYRPDIDGLRALAVLLVVASHLHVTHLSGGYIGVDVFFVISGYLISSIIIPQITTGSFSLRDFYLRRLRRIAPALFVMLACTIPFARHYLFPNELAAYARSLLAAMFAYSNTLFWGWRGYFDTSNELKPLLHTWSLGVEEQFYFAFPLLLLGIARLRKPRYLRNAIFSLAALSFAGSLWFVAHNGRIAFFAAPFRAWELLLGAMLHFLPARLRHLENREAEKAEGRLLTETLALVGVGLIVLPAISYTDDTLFPGLAALAPCLGAALLIATGERPTLIRRLLTLRPIVFLGLISYSVYLWHWPLIVFANLRHTWTCEAAACAAPVSAATRGALFILTLFLGALSWRFIEQPFRTQRLATPTLLKLATVSAAILVLVATHILRSKGEPSRFPASATVAAGLLDFDTHDPWRWSTCALALDESPTHFNEQTCLPFTPGHKHYLLLGDSHAAQLWPGLHAIFPEAQIGQVNVAGCNLLPFKQQDSVPTCRAVAKYVYNTLLPSHHIDALIVDAQWHPEDLPHIAELLSYARARNIDTLLIGPNDAFTLSYPRLLARLELQHRVADLPTFTDAAQHTLDRQMSALAQSEWHVPYISLLTQPCLGDLRCTEAISTSIPLYLDRHHLTPVGALSVAQTLRDQHRLP